MNNPKPEAAQIYESLLNISKENVDTEVSSIVESQKRLKELLCDSKDDSSDLLIDRVMNDISASDLKFKCVRFLHKAKKLTMADNSDFVAFAASKDFYHLSTKYQLCKQLNEKHFTNEQRKTHLNKKILIIGCGPAGLRMAIELALKGIQNITMIDERNHFSRKQIVRIWKFTLSDLIALGIQDIFANFCSSPDVKSVPITYLQHFLLRVALLFDVNIHVGTRFVNIDFQSNKINLLQKKDGDSDWDKLSWDNDFDVLIDASGTNGILRDSKVTDDTSHDGASNDVSNDIANDAPNDASNDAKEENKENKENKEDLENKENESENVLIGTKAMDKRRIKDIIGITANFHRIKGDAKNFKQILGMTQYFYQKQFNEKSVHLENIVYYRSDISNYLVATVIKESLLKYDIFNDDKLHGFNLVQRKNLKMENVRKLILKIATEWNIPHPKDSDEPFMLKPNKSEDFAIFQFGILKEANKPVLFKNGQMICCVGDSAYAPFWPKGTGVNHAVIGVYILTDAIIKWFDTSKENLKNEEKEIEASCFKDFHDLSKDLNDKVWHQNRFAQYLPKYELVKGIISGQ